jgi:exosortase
MKTLLLLLPSFIALGWLVSKAQWYWNHRPDLQFGWGVLVICGYLFWMAWGNRPEARGRWSVSSLLCAVLGCGLLFLTQIYQAAFGMMPASLMGLAAGTMLVVAANLLYAFGWAGLRHFAFAYGFLLIALPMPSAIQNLIVGGLQSLVAAINVEVLNLMGVPAQQTGSLIQLPLCTVGIDEACSGVRSLQASIMVALFVGYLKLQNNWLRVLLVVLGIGLATFGNVVRSLFLSLQAHWHGTEAIKNYHDAAGWSILVFTFAGVAVLAWLLRKIDLRWAPEDGGQRSEVRASREESSSGEPGGKT